MEILKEFGARVRELRKAKGFSQEKLAQKSHLHYTYIGAVERGERNPSLLSIQKIAEGLGVEITSLFYFPGKGDQREKVLSEILQHLSVKKRSQVSTILKIIKSL